MFLRMLLLVIISPGLVLYCQNDFKNLNPSKNKNVTVEIQKENSPKVTVTFIKVEAVKQVISFLKRAKFKEIKKIDFDKEEVIKNWVYKISFTASRDQILLCSGYGVIGKTIYKMNNRWLEGFADLFKKLNK